MKTTLYNISDQYLAFVQMVESGEIDDVQAIDDTLDAIQQAFDDKVDNIACLFKSLSAEAEAIEKEAKRLAERAKHKRNVCDRLKAYLSSNMRAIGQDRFENDRNRISFRRSETLEITNEDYLCDALAAAGRPDLMHTVTERKFDKNAIKKAINDGATFDGAKINTNFNIQIN